MSYLSLLSKIYYKRLKDKRENLNDLICFIQYESEIILESVNSLPKLNNTPYLLPPGTHDYLSLISESVCITIQANNLLNNKIDISAVLNELSKLLKTCSEYSTYLTIGVINYYQSWSQIQPIYDLSSMTIEIDNKHISSEFNELLFSLLKTNVYESINNWESINNRLNLNKVIQKILTTLN